MSPSEGCDSLATTAQEIAAAIGRSTGCIPVKPAFLDDTRVLATRPSNGRRCKGVPTSPDECFIQSAHLAVFLCISVRCSLFAFWIKHSDEKEVMSASAPGTGADKMNSRKFLAKTFLTVKSFCVVNLYHSPYKQRKGGEKA